MFWTEEDQLYSQTGSPQPMTVTDPRVILVNHDSHEADHPITAPIFTTVLWQSLSEPRHFCPKPEVNTGNWHES